MTRTLAAGAALLFTAFCTAVQAAAATHRVTGLAPGRAVNVRAEPMPTAADIGDASLGLPLQVIAHEDSWLAVRWGAGRGWISKRFVSPIDSPAARAAEAHAPAWDRSVAARPAAAPRPVPASRTEAPTAHAPTPSAPAAAPASTVAAATPTVGQRVTSVPAVVCVGDAPSWSFSVSAHGAVVLEAPDQTRVYGNPKWHKIDADNYRFALGSLRGTVRRSRCPDQLAGESMDWQLSMDGADFTGIETLAGCCLGR